MKPDSTTTSNTASVSTSSTHVEQQERAGVGEPQNPGDLAPTGLRISDAGRHVEPVHCGNNGQHQGDLQDPHPSPPSGRTGKTDSRKRTSSFPPAEDGRQEHHSPVKHQRLDSQHAVDYLRKEWLEIRKVPKVNKKKWVYYCRDKNVIKYLGLTKSIESVRKILDRNNNNSPNSNLCDDRYIRGIILNVIEQVEVPDKNKQYALAFLTDSDQRLQWKITPEIPDQDNHLHSEDFILKEIIERLESGGFTKNSHLYIYSLNSPCIGRKHDHPCIFLLYCLSCVLFKRYEIQTYIGFSIYYGFAGPISGLLANNKDHQQVKQAIKESEKSSPRYKFSLKNTKKFNVCNCVKNAIEGEDQTALLQRLDTFKPGVYKSFNTLDGWKNELNEILITEEKKFEELLREIADEDRYERIRQAFRSGFEEWWNASVGLALLSEHINRTALQFFIQDSQDLLPQLLTEGSTSLPQASFLKFIEVPLPEFS
ncbi:uncharacterized protein LOC108415758 [Pygocentrus nattereri]|uniref:uncharacterized protein LOC108415758 n=1 Tax=Pygocentrus nattereri TaxID=42514 RepID=UPI0018919A15|nr:uncharacterized protein LOC108415758 [Pygocentrus nattereri]